MTAAGSGAPGARPRYDDRPTAEDSVLATGVTAFAAVLMIMAGILHLIQGTIALVNDTFFVYGAEYVFRFDATGWGWAHLVLGLLVLLAGIALLRGELWARVLTGTLACVSIIASFLWMPYYPVWNIVVIAFDVAVLWAVTTRPMSR